MGKYTVILVYSSVIAVDVEATNEVEANETAMENAEARDDFQKKVIDALELEEAYVAEGEDGS